MPFCLPVCDHCKLVCGDEPLGLEPLCEHPEHFREIGCSVHLVLHGGRMDILTKPTRIGTIISQQYAHGQGCQVVTQKGGGFIFDSLFKVFLSCVIVTDKIQMLHPSLKNGPAKASNCLVVRTAAVVLARVVVIAKEGKLLFQNLRNSTETSVTNTRH